MCTVKDDIIQSLGQKLDVMKAEATRLERALAEEEEFSLRRVSELEDRLQEALLASKRNVDDDGGDMSPSFSPHPLRSMTPLEKSRVAASSGAADAPAWTGTESDKDSLLAHFGLAARAQSCDADVYGHAQGSSLAPQIATVTPVIAAVMEQLYKSRRPQKPIESSVIVTNEGEIQQLNQMELQRQSLRRRMAKISKTSESIECAAKALLSVVALEDVSQGGGSNQPRRPALAAAAASSTSAGASAIITATRRGSTIGVQTGRATNAVAEEPLPIDLFLENQQRADFISNVTAALTALPPNLCQDFVAEIMRQVSCFGAGVAVASEAIAILSVGDDLSSLCVQAEASLMRVSRVQRVQLFEIQWDSRSLVPLVDGRAQERDDLGVSRRIPIGQGYAGKCIHMGPQIVNFPASLGQDFQPSDRGEGVVASTILALPIGLPGQPPVMVATLINKLLPLGAPQQQQLDALQKGNTDSSPFGVPAKQRPPPASADKPPFGDSDIAIGMAVGFYIAQKAMRCRLAGSMARLHAGMMARACAMGGTGAAGDIFMSCVRSQELCAAILSDVRAAANWTCIDMMLVFAGPPILLGAATGIESCTSSVAGESRASNLWAKSSVIVHVVRDDVTTSATNPAVLQPTSAQLAVPSRLVTKPVSEASLSQCQAQLATQWLPQNFRKPATLETKSLLQTQSLLLNQIVCVTVTESVIPTEVGTDYAVVRDLDSLETGGVSTGETKTMPLNNVEEIVRYACADTARGMAQCTVLGQSLISSLEDAASSWAMRYSDNSHNPSSHIFARMESSSSVIAACPRPFHSGASNGRQCVFMPVTGAAGAVIAVLRAEKNVQMQSGVMGSPHSQYFSQDEMEALECAARHCGSALQVAYCKVFLIFFL